MGSQVGCVASSARNLNPADTKGWLLNSQNAAFQRLLADIHTRCIPSPEPILLLGPTGTGKTEIARRIYKRKFELGTLTGQFVHVDCATIATNELAESELFGHLKGAFSGAITNQVGKLTLADEGLLFLDEIGELECRTQAKLSTALDREGGFSPRGSTEICKPRFQLVTATNRDLLAEVRQKRFRLELYERIVVWQFSPPSLKDRPEDMDLAVERLLGEAGNEVMFDAEARERFLRFAESAAAVWTGNWREFNATVRRLIGSAADGVITVQLVENEMSQLTTKWRALTAGNSESLVAKVLGSERARAHDDIELAKSA